MKVLGEGASIQTYRAIEGWVFGIWLVKIALAPIHLLSELPVEIFEPVGLAKIFPAALRPLLVTLPFIACFKAAAIGSLILDLTAAIKADTSWRKARLKRWRR